MTTASFPDTVGLTQSPSVRAQCQQRTVRLLLSQQTLASSTEEACCYLGSSWLVAEVPDAAILAIRGLAVSKLRSGW